MQVEEEQVGCLRQGAAATYQTVMQHHQLTATCTDLSHLLSIVTYQPCPSVTRTKEANMAEPQLSSDTTAVFQQLDNYDWDHDKDFQTALASILRSAETPEQTAHLTTRARCYYYTR